MPGEHAGVGRHRVHCDPDCKVYRGMTGMTLPQALRAAVVFLCSMKRRKSNLHSNADIDELLKNKCWNTRTLPEDIISEFQNLIFIFQLVILNQVQHSNSEHLIFQIGLFNKVRNSDKLQTKIVKKDDYKITKK